MRIPVATYRLQFHPEFKFSGCASDSDLPGRIGNFRYLCFGPSSKPGGVAPMVYDVVDPSQLNPELGSDEDFAELTSELSQRGMGWLQDIVPNHIGLRQRKSLPWSTFWNMAPIPNTATFF